MLKTILVSTVLLAVCAFVLAFQLGKRSSSAGASLSVEVGWDRARPQLHSAFLEQLGAVFDRRSVAVAPEILKSVASCMVDEVAVFLNATDCSLTYRESEKSEIRHLREQSECLQRAGYEKELQGFTLRCLREKLPDDWKMTVPAMETALRTKLIEAGIPATEAEAQSACYAGMAAVALNESGCRLIDREALRVDNLVRGSEECSGPPDTRSELDRFMRTCTKGRFPVPVTAVESLVQGKSKRDDPLSAFAGARPGILPLTGKHCPLDYHRRGKLCLHAEMLSLNPEILESIIQSYRRDGPLPLIQQK